jgi:small subunit ribosomal protein S6
MRKYELMMILNPELSADEQKELIAAIESEIQHAGAKIASENHPGERDLAYRIHGSRKGYYLLYTLESEKGDFFAATKVFNIKTNIWRFMFVKIED